METRVYLVWEITRGNSTKATYTTRKEKTTNKILQEEGWKFIGVMVAKGSKSWPTLHACITSEVLI